MIHVKSLIRDYSAGQFLITMSKVMSKLMSKFMSKFMPKFMPIFLTPCAPGDVPGIHVVYTPVLFCRCLS